VARLQDAVSLALGGLGTGTAVCLAIASFAVGLGPLLFPRRITLFLVVGASLALDYWVLGQSMGGLLSGTATDPNVGPLFVLFALVLLPNATLDPRRVRPATAGRDVKRLRQDGTMVGLRRMRPLPR
jgi:hypothetical protein